MADPTQFRAWSGINPGRLFTLIDSLDHFIGFQLPCGHHPSPLCIHETKAIMLMVRNRGFTLILWLLCCNWNGQSPCGLMLWVSLPFRGVRLGAQVFFFLKKKDQVSLGLLVPKNNPKQRVWNSKNQNRTPQEVVNGLGFGSNSCSGDLPGNVGFFFSCEENCYVWVWKACVWDLGVLRCVLFALLCLRPQQDSRPIIRKPSSWWIYIVRTRDKGC